MLQDHYVQVLAVSPGKEAGCRSRVDKICSAFAEDPMGGRDVKDTIDFELQVKIHFIGITFFDFIAVKYFSMNWTNSPFPVS